MKPLSQASVLAGGATRAATLMLTLLFVSGTALVVVSLLILSRERTRHSSYASHAERGRLAVDAALEEAKLLLLNATANDRYLVSHILADPGNPGGGAVSSQSRYYYILDPEASGVRCIPLFAGGKVTKRSYPPDPQESSLAPGGSDLFESGVEMTRVLRLPPLTHDTGTALVRENNQVATGWIDLFKDKEGSPMFPELQDPATSIRYTYWIEDLEGYPNLDAIGIPSGSNREGLALRWQGYGGTDPRVGNASERPGGEYRYEFPRDIGTRPEGRAFQYVQQMADQVSPGLSPREIHVFPWPKPYFPLEANPFFGYAMMRRNPWLFPGTGTEVLAAPLFPAAAAREAFVRGIESRFAMGLLPYLKLPLIPYGFGYGEEGKPAINLNVLVQSGHVDAVADAIQRNLPKFGLRKGGFPEDYLRTLAASLVDYADVDSEPTVRSGSYRGIDSYPVMNEVFFRIEYQGYTVAPDGSRFLARFVAEPFVEFWNPGNQAASLSRLSLRVSIPDQQGLVVRTGAGQTGSFDGTEMNKGEADHPENATVSVRLEPNEYRVIPFGRMRWEFSFPTQGLAVLSLGRIQAGKAGLLAGKDGGNSRVHFELLWTPDATKPGEKVVIDSTGRPGPGKGNNHGFHLRRYGEKGDASDDMYRSEVSYTDNSLSTGEYMIRAAVPGLCTSYFDEATNFGDARMAAYPDCAQKAEYYTWDGSPGYRNVLVDKADSGSFTHEARVRDWPDGGYDSPAPPPDRVRALGRKKPVRPTELAPPDPGDQRPLLAPARSSNQGRFYSLAELGNVFDPVMWRPDASTKASDVSREQVLEISSNAVPDSRWGGGNSLRVGRKEHPRFDHLGSRASQLLDIFHVGVPGTNCQFGGYQPVDMMEGKLPEDLYAEYDFLLHHPPPTARNRQEAADRSRPFRRIYPVELHAESPCRWIQGQINLNSVPTTFEVEALLRGAFSSVLVHWSGAGWRRIFGNVDLAGRGMEELARHGLSESAAAEMARTIYEARPFLSHSHLAQVVGKALEPRLPQDESLPAGERTRSYCSDALAEEIFARIHNATTLSSRHFRIHAQGQVLTKARSLPDGSGLREGGQILARASSVQEVFLRPIRDETGGLVSVQVQVLNSRSR